MARVVYFSSVSENTLRFVERLGIPALRIPLYASDPALKVTEEFVLILPTYGGGKGAGGEVPKQVVRFLNDPDNRALLRGVIAAGNTNFGEDFCRAGDIIAAKCNVPYLYRFELLGTDQDVTRVREGLAQFWLQRSQIPA